MWGGGGGGGGGGWGGGGAGPTRRTRWPGFPGSAAPASGTRGRAATTGRCSPARASFASRISAVGFLGDVYEGAFTGWAGARRGVGLFAKMLAEGYRWHGVAAYQFWFGPDQADLHRNSFQPVCVLCREWNNSFGAGE